jgi:hypothetical protein
MVSKRQQFETHINYCKWCKYHQFRLCDRGHSLLKIIMEEEPLYLTLPRKLVLGY